MLKLGCEFVRTCKHILSVHVCGRVSMCTKLPVWVRKNDWVPVRLCIHPSIRFSIGIYLNIYVRMLLSAALSNVCVSVGPFVCQPVSRLCESMFVQPSDFSVHPFIYIHFVCFLFVRWSVRSSVHPPVLLSVRQFECIF